MMNGRGKSDSSKVPVKLPNKAEEPVAEAMEGRGLAEGNSPEGNVSPFSRCEAAFLKTQTKPDPSGRPPPTSDTLFNRDLTTKELAKHY
jgi:hypothetical protein